jgi:hypothetical protein
MDTDRGDRELFQERTCYTLAHPHPSFLRRLAVDACAARYAAAHEPGIQPRRKAGP